MSDFSMPPNSAGPKQISSRLLNMKFMQRATASTAQRTPFSPSTPSDERRPKRRRTGDDFSTTVSNLNSPITPMSSRQLSTEANVDSVKQESNNSNTPGEETQWKLDVRIPIANGTTNGKSTYHESDDESESQSEEDDDIWSATAPPGRQTYGSFNKKKQKTAISTPAPGATPTPSEKSAKKRNGPDEADDEDLSSLLSDSASDDGSEGEIKESPRPRKPGKFDFGSEADLKRMDASDLQKSGFERSLGRQRSGLGGGGGGGRASDRGFGSPAARRGKPKKKNRKGT